MSEHPTAADLELVALGEGADEARAHVEACAACAKHVALLVDGARRFEIERPAAPFMDAVLQRAESARSTEPSNVVSFERLLRTRIVWGLAPLAAAAIMLVMFRPTARPLTEGAGAEGPGFNATASGDTTFKGGMAVATIRERDGVQERLVGDLDVRAFDRIRLELALDGARPIAAGIVADDGTWASLVAPALLDGGTHFSELSVRFDASPRDGWIVVGPPEAVEKVRVSGRSALARGDFARELRVLRVHAVK